MSLATELLEALEGEARIGNAVAVIAIARIAGAADPDAEAKAVCDEVVRAVQAIVRVVDALDLGDHADWCWRCDAASSETEVGLCVACLRDLRQ